MPCGKTLSLGPKSRSSVKVTVLVFTNTACSLLISEKTTKHCCGHGVSVCVWAGVRVVVQKRWHYEMSVITEFIHLYFKLGQVFMKRAIHKAWTGDCRSIFDRVMSLLWLWNLIWKSRTWDGLVVIWFYATYEKYTYLCHITATTHLSRPYFGFIGIWLCTV